MLKKIVLSAALSLSLYAMHNAEININDKDLEASFKLDMGQFNDTVAPDTTYLGVKYLKASDSYSEYENNAQADLGYYFDVDFLIKQEIKNSGFYFGLGVKGVFSEANDVSFSAIPLGVEAMYKLPIKNFIPISFGVEAYYAPESLSFSNSQSYLEYRGELSAEIIERGSIYVGYRNIDTNYLNIDLTYNKSAYFGFKFKF